MVWQRATQWILLGLSLAVSAVPADAAMRPELCVLTEPSTSPTFQDDLFQRWQESVIRSSVTPVYSRIQFGSCDGTPKDAPVDVWALDATGAQVEVAVRTLQSAGSNLRVLLTATSPGGPGSAHAQAFGPATAVEVDAPRAWRVAWLLRLGHGWTQGPSFAQAVREGALLATRDLKGVALGDSADALAPSQLAVHGTDWDAQGAAQGEIKDAVELRQDPLDPPEGNSIWLDGEVLRYYFEPLQEWIGGDLSGVLDKLQGARLTRDSRRLNVSVIFDTPQRISMLPPGQRPRTGQPAWLELPEELRFGLAIRGDRFEVGGLDQSTHTARLGLRAPVGTMTANLRSIRVNLTTGAVRVEAGLLQNAVGLVARGQFFAKKFDGVAVRDTLGINWPWLSLPLLLFLL